MLFIRRSLNLRMIYKNLHKMKNRWILLICLTSVWFARVTVAESAAVPLSLDLFTALKIAADKNPSLIMADERVKQALERLRQTRASFFPQVAADISESRQTKNLETVGLKPAGNSSPVVGPFNAFDARLRLTQILFDWAMVKRLEAAGAAQNLSKAEQKKVKQDALALVAALFIEAKRAEDSVRFSKAFLRLAQEKHRIMRTHFKLGTGSEMDLKSADADLSDARYQWRTALTMARNKRLDLKAALGFSEAQVLSLQDEQLSWGVALPKRAELLNAAVKHPETTVAEETLRKSHADTAAEKAEYLPKVSGLADYGASADQPNNSKETYSYGVQLSWPLFEGGQRNARIAESQSRSREAQTNFNTIQDQKEIQAFEAKEVLKNAKVLIRAKGDHFEFYRSELELTKRCLKNGSASELDVIRAMAEEAQAKDARDEAVATYRVAQVSLAHALGQMDQFVIANVAEGVAKQSK